MRSWCWRLGAVGGITLAGCSILGSTAGESCHGGSNCCRVALQEVPQSRGRAGGGGRATGVLAAGGGHIWSNGCYASQHQASHLSGFFGPRRFPLEVWTI